MDHDRGRTGQLDALRRELARLRAASEAAWAVAAARRIEARFAADEAERLGQETRRLIGEARLRR